MKNEIKFSPAMVRCSESHRNALDGVRTPVAGFLFTPKTSSYVSIKSIQVQVLCL